MKIRFGEFELDSRRYRLRRNGETIALRPKVFDLLIYLARHRERVVPREELVRMCWGETRVGEGSLSGLINELRGALGEGARGPSSIRTVHARGYQFVAPVEPESGTGSRRAGHEDRGDLSEALLRIRLELGRMLTEGPRGLVLLAEGDEASRSLLEQAMALSGHLGVESLRPCGGGTRGGGTTSVGTRDGSPLTVGCAELTARLLRLVVERWGVPVLRERARSDLDRVLQPRPREAGPDAMDWDRALRRLLRQRARERPLMLLFEGLECFEPAALELLESLLGIELESAPLLVVASVDRTALAALSRSEETVARPLERLLFGSGFALFRHRDPERARLDAWCRERGVEPLPEPLVEALLAHLAGSAAFGDPRSSESATLEPTGAGDRGAPLATAASLCEARPTPCCPSLPERPRLRWARTASLEPPRRVNDG